MIANKLIKLSLCCKTKSYRKTKEYKELDIKKILKYFHLLISKHIKCVCTLWSYWLSVSESHLRHRPPIPIHSHQFHLLPLFCVILVLVETGAIANISFGEITSISGQILLNGSSTGSLRQKCPIFSIHWL